MRLGIARLSQETSTFSPQLTDLATIRAYGLARGPAVLDHPDTGEEYIAGFRDAAAGEVLVGVTLAQAMPAGCLTGEAMAQLLDWFTEDLERARPLDGLLLSMHGALAGLDDPDVEGLFLERARQVLGDGVVIGAALDLHANITRRKIAHTDVVDGLHTHPHVDSRQVGRRVAETVLRAVRGEVRPVIRAVKIPMVTPAENQITAQAPLRDLMATTRQQEQAGALLSSVFAVQPWLDVPGLGWCSVVIADGDADRAEAMARQLADQAWRHRAEYTRPCPSYLEALDQAFATAERPIVISDLADLMTGGGSGDSTWYLNELLRRAPSEPCYVSMVDPESAALMAQAGPGRPVCLRLGGKIDHLHSTPVEVEGTVVRVIPPAPGRQLPAGMGLTAVLQVGAVYVVVFERLGPGSDPIIYAGAGLDPRQAKLMIAKSVVDFREGYKDVAVRFLQGEAPGLAPSRLDTLSWKQVTRPLYPLDAGLAWDSSRAPVYRSRPRAAGA